ncbi:hypothetical protein D3C87_913010 [compost metagenome]
MAARVWGPTSQRKIRIVLSSERRIALAGSETPSAPAVKTVTPLLIPEASGLGLIPERVSQVWGWPSLP